MDEKIPPSSDTRREAMYSHCHSLLNSLEEGSCDEPLQGLACIIRLICEAESIKLETDLNEANG